MATLPPDTCHDAYYHYLFLWSSHQVGFSVSRSRTSNTSWRKYLYFCTWLTLASDIAVVANLILYLQIFVEQVRVGILAAGVAAIQKRNIEIYLRYVAHMFSDVGAADPCLDHLG